MTQDPPGEAVTEDGPWATMRVADAFETNGSPFEKEPTPETEGDATLGMIRQIASQLDKLTGMVEGQDSEGGWMGADLSDLVRSTSADGSLPRP